MVALALSTTHNRAPVVKESDFSIVPHAVATRSQRREGGGFTISARAVGLYAQIRKHCHRQRKVRGGASCEVSLALLAAAAGVKPRQARNLRRQLVEQGMIVVDLEGGFHGVNVYHLVLPVPPAVEALLPGRQARTPGPHYVVTPATPALSHPRQDFAAAVDLGVDFDVGVSGLLEPTPETGSGAGSSGPALSAAEPPAAPALRPSGRGAKAGPGPARAGHDDDDKGRAGEAKIARGMPAAVAGDDEKLRARLSAGTGRVVELWPHDDEKRRQVLERFLRQEFPGIPDQVVRKTLEAWRAARLEQATGGARVRSAWRYCAKVAARILGAAGGLPGPVSGPPAGAAPGAGVFLGSKLGPNHGPALSQGEPTAVASSNSSEIDTCKHGHSLDEECRTCDRTAPTAFLRALRRQQLRPGRGTVQATGGASTSVDASPSRSPAPTREGPRK
jgi:hypothetical protein